MNENNNRFVVAAIIVVVAMFVLFAGGSMMTGGQMGGGFAGAAWMGGVGWIWIPAALIVCLVVMVALGLFGKKQI